MTLKKVWVLLYTFVRVLLNTSILTVWDSLYMYLQAGDLIFESEQLVVTK